MELALQRIREAKQHRLTRLDLGDCGLTELPDELFELTWLEELDLSDQILHDDFEERQRDKAIKAGTYKGKLNDIIYINPQIKQLTSLKTLIIKGESWIITYRSALKDITALRFLMSLQYLDISGTQVSNLAPLKDLVNLQYLNISNTKVRDLNSLKDLKNLKQLDVSSTQVSDLSPLKKIIEEVALEEWLTGGIRFSLSVENCPLNNPPKEIVQQGNAAILRYWEQIEKQGGFEVNYEAKLIIVGEGRTGKTTLYNKLINPNYVLQPLDETHGINIYEGLPFNNNLIGENTFHANLWDFGGQELQYMTHQFFLTPRALYVLMMDARKEAPNLAYWLKIISLLGKDSQDSTEKVRLLLVFNKRQNSTGTPPQYQDTLQYYQDHLDVQYLEVDFSENDKRFENLKESIERNLVTLPIVKSQLPRKWKDVREDLRQEAKTRTHISTERFSEICSKHSITDEQDQLQLSDYLHKLGSLLHFQNDKTLINWVFLSPEWVVEGVYGFLKNDSIAKQNGKFTEDDFFKILSTTKNDKNYTYTRADSAKILQLMTKNNFDICYQSANDNYVAAQLLPENAPPQYNWLTDIQALKFRYQYPVMPKGLMSRLIVRLSEYLEIMDNVEVVWKKGAILSIKTDKNDPKSLCRILMKEDDAESKDGLRQIIFEVMGDPASHRKHALQRVREEVESLHKRWFRSIKADEMVPCCCTECRQSAKPELYKLEKLLKLREKRAETVCYSSGEDISIFQLLEGVYEESEIKNMGSRDGFRRY